MGFLNDVSLANVGWKPVFQQQLALFPDHLAVARVVAVQRTGLSIAPSVGSFTEVVLGGKWFVMEIEARATVGDWVLVDPQTGALEHVLERLSLIKRMSAGTAGEIQLIAANIDTAFIVTSCNSDFSLSRLERYLAAIVEADIFPVVVLTKKDLTDDADFYVEQVRSLDMALAVEAVNALSAADVDSLSGWCTQGQSIALLGSSGVGKSTLVNTLSGATVQLTQASRGSDDKGRHTTTHRSLHMLPQGGVILDSPGMREFQIADAQSGVNQVFDDIVELASTCRFNDCQHDAEPGCVVRQAVADGKLDERRLQSFFKLAREEQFNRETTAQRHTRVRKWSKTIKETQKLSHKKRT
ncbi:MAG: ribosome small subunit-dependent GTPase A [Gammaproteobacteria bacterium]|nr:ribosome small subunit-dependent GTPase A [Gammaproteobacteria bacterium]